MEIGNGSGLYIKNVGTAVYTNPFNHCTFSLNNLFHVPHITKHLLNVSRFALDNDVFFEFHPHHCFVKKQGSFFAKCLRMVYMCFPILFLFLHLPLILLLFHMQMIHTSYGMHGLNMLVHANGSVIHRIMQVATL